ncbi:MAG: prepilin peptidase [Actinomycetota bacterium]
MAPLVMGLLGVILGSFANVVIYRAPKGLSVVKPPSHCTDCEHFLEWYENIPVFSFVFLRGRCKGCGAPISARYPLIELIMGMVWAATTYRIGLSPALPMFLFFVTILVVLSAIDLEVRRLPNKVLWPASIAAVALGLAAALISRDLTNLSTALLGTLAYGLPMLGIGLAVPGGMGGGDIKFAGYLGWHLGWLGLGRVAVGALLGFILGGLLGIALLLAGRKGRKDAIPFGPSMAFGAFVSMLVGNLVLTAWLG